MSLVLFVLKKTVSQFLMPLSLVLELLLAGLILLWFTNRRKAGQVVVTIGACLLLLAGFGILSDALLAKLEGFYPPLDVTAARSSGAKWIVVLAGGHSTDPRLPATGQLAPETQVRLNEGIRLYRAIPGSKLLLSGGKVFGSRSTAVLMSDLARDLGVNPRDIVLEDKSRDTGDEAELIRPMLGRERFILVTSAYHMPRSMMLFSEQGLQPIPAPTCHYSHPDEAITPEDFFPRVSKIRDCETVLHEVLGIMAIEIKEAF